MVITATKYLNVLRNIDVDSVFVSLLQELNVDGTESGLDPHLHIDSLSRLWDRFMMAHQEKDMAILAEIDRYAMDV